MKSQWDGVRRGWLLAVETKYYFLVRTAGMGMCGLVPFLSGLFSERLCESVLRYTIPVDTICV